MMCVLEFYSHHLLTFFITVNLITTICCQLVILVFRYIYFNSSFNLCNILSWFLVMLKWIYYIVHSLVWQLNNNFTFVCSFLIVSNWILIIMINSLISEVSSLTEEVEEIKQKNVKIHIHTQTYNFRGKFRKKVFIVFWWKWTQKGKMTK